MDKDPHILPFVLDDVSYSQRKSDGTKPNFGHLPKPDHVNDKTIKGYFDHHVGNLSPLNLKRFLEFQINNSPKPELLLEYFEYEYLVSFKAKIEFDKSYYQHIPVLQTSRHSAEKKIELFEEIIAKGVKKKKNQPKEEFREFISESIIDKDAYIQSFKKAVKGLQGKGLRTAISILIEANHLDLSKDGNISKLHRTLVKELAPDDIATLMAFQDEYHDVPGQFKYTDIKKSLQDLLTDYHL